MNNPEQKVILRHPTMADSQAVFDLMSTCDVAEFGESDSSLEDLVDLWSEIDLNTDAWLVLMGPERVIGYAAVYGEAPRFTFEYDVHPDLAPVGLTRAFLKQCEARARERLDPNLAEPPVVSTMVSQLNQANRQIVEDLGFSPHHYYYGMRIHMDAPPPAPVWPDGITLRTAEPGLDDLTIYNLIQATLNHSDPPPPAFEQWCDGMLGDNFDEDLWFLAFAGDELVGAALCFDYPQSGWVRQLAVAEAWRRQGLGLALLQHAFGVFHQRWHTLVGLNVSSDTPNAYQLYEKAGMKCLQSYVEYQKTLMAE